MSISTVINQGTAALKNAGDTAVERAGGTIQSEYTMNEIKTLINSIQVPKGTITPDLYYIHKKNFETTVPVLSSLYDELLPNDFIYFNGEHYAQCDSAHEPEGIVLEVGKDGAESRVMLWAEPLGYILNIHETIRNKGGYPELENLADLLKSVKTVPTLARTGYGNGEAVRATSAINTSIPAGTGGYIDEWDMFTPHANDTSKEVNAITLGVTDSTHAMAVVKCND